jgi:hypothetical protein
VDYDPDGGRVYDGVVTLPRQFLWFRGDWGGKAGILRFLRGYDLLPRGVRPRLTHRAYDWSLDLENFDE